MATWCMAATIANTALEAMLLGLCIISIPAIGTSLYSVGQWKALFTVEEMF